MAEGMLRQWGGEDFEAYSAGVEATRVRPEAIAVMRELGIDISRQRSKAVSEYAGQDFDWAVTVCDDAKEACPFFPARRSKHWSFADPSAATGSEDERLAVFRRVRDEIAEQVRSFAGWREAEVASGA
jgi:arsenate reductase